MAEGIGPLVRLWGIRPGQLPTSESSGDITLFLEPIIKEALSFISTVPSSSDQRDDGPWRRKGRVTFPHSSAPVHLFERDVSAQDLASVARLHGVASGKLGSETWFLRRSVHEDEARRGTAAWGEWVKSFKEGHAEAEKEFTPSVLSTRALRSWDCDGIAVPLGEITWESISLKLEESVHKMPPPIKNRVFPVLQLTASARERQEFLVVQIAAVPDANTPEEVRSDGTLRGAYTSIERFRAEPAEKRVEWVMGTVSDARGRLPMWVQRMAVPGRVAKDVDMFLEWIDKKRRY